MLAAHSDEIGLMVKGFDEGFIRFARVGGVDVRTIVGQEVTVHGKRPLPGIVASRPPHVLSAEERKKVIALDKLFIDVGMSADRVKEMVRVGDFVTMRRDFIELAEGYVSGKEVGLRGAITSAYGIAPDLAIAVDVGFGLQQGVAEQEAISMDGGPAIAIGPNFHPLLHESIVATAKASEIKYQLEVSPGPSGTDAWAIQVAREGIPTALFSIPLRYMHTSVETICIKDIERTGRLIAEFIAGLDEDSAAKLAL